MDWLWDLLEDFVDENADDASDDLIRELEDTDPDELVELCRHLWMLKLLVYYCETRGK